MLIESRQIEVAQRIYERMKDWQKADEVIREYFREHPNNDNFNMVAIKVVLAHTLYNARIKSVLAVADAILEIESLDDRITEGDRTLVDSIIENAQRKGEDKIISFASKYCSFHNDNYPIYDGYVVLALKEINGGKRCTGILGVKNTILENKNYEDYCNVIDTLKNEKFNLQEFSYRDIDKYLWLYGQKHVFDHHERGRGSLQKDIRRFFEDETNRELLEVLEPE